MKSFFQLANSLDGFNISDLDCFFCGWNSHRTGIPREEADGYDWTSKGWDERNERTEFVLSKFYEKKV